MLVGPTLTGAYDLPINKCMTIQEPSFPYKNPPKTAASTTPPGSAYEINRRRAQELLDSDKLDSSIEQCKAHAWFFNNGVVLPISEVNGGTTTASPATASASNQASAASKRPSSGGGDDSNGDDGTPPRKFRKTGKGGGGGGASTAMSPNKTFQKNPLLINVTRTRSDDMVATPDKNGLPPYMTQTVNYMQNNPDWAKSVLMTDRATNRCDFNNPKNYMLFQTTEKGYKR